jgi:hypothetical protein
MDDEHYKSHQELSQQILQVTTSQYKQVNDQLTAQLQETRNALEKLAAVSGLEYIGELKDWVSKGKWAEFRKSPREDK